MRIFNLKILFLLLIGSHFVSAEVVSMGVGMLRGQLVTSRQVHIQRLLELALYEKSPKLKLPGLDSKVFASAARDTLLEMAIALEAQNFNLVQVSSSDIEAAEKQANDVLAKNDAWRQLQVLPKERLEAIKIKLQAKKFSRFRAQSSELPVTNSEAQRYFNENRLKYGNLPFENFKENIKAFLSRNQIEQRLKDWHEVLLSKYQVKNLIAEI